MADSERRTAIGLTPRCQTREKEHNANGTSAAHSFVCTQNLIFINGNTHQVNALLCERAMNVCFCLSERFQTHNVAEDNGTAKFKEHTNRNHFAFCRNYRPRSERERKCVLIIIALFAFLLNRARWFGHIFPSETVEHCLNFLIVVIILMCLTTFAHSLIDFGWCCEFIRNRRGIESHTESIFLPRAVSVLTMNVGGKSFG